MKTPRLKRDWVGLRVVSCVPLSNGLARLPAGTFWRVKRNYGGLELVSEPCPTCGIRLRITRVPERDVNIVESDDDDNEAPGDLHGRV